MGDCCSCCPKKHAPKAPVTDKKKAVVSLKELAATDKMLECLKNLDGNTKDLAEIDDDGMPKDHIKDESNIAVFRRPGELTNGMLSIADCDNAVICCLDLVKSLIIDRCTNSTIVVFGVSGSGFARNCENCTISIVSQQLRLKNCKGCDISCFTTSGAVFEECEALILHNYSLLIPKWMSTQRWLSAFDCVYLAAVGLKTNISRDVHDFSNPGGDPEKVCFESVEYGPDDDATRPAIHVMSAERSRSDSVPMCTTFTPIRDIILDPSTTPVPEEGNTVFVFVPVQPHNITLLVRFALLPVAKKKKEVGTWLYAVSSQDLSGIITNEQTVRGKEILKSCSSIGGKKGDGVTAVGGAPLVYCGILTKCGDAQDVCTSVANKLDASGVSGRDSPTDFCCFAVEGGKELHEAIRACAVY